MDVWDDDKPTSKRKLAAVVAVQCGFILLSFIVWYVVIVWLFL